MMHATKPAPHAQAALQPVRSVQAAPARPGVRRIVQQTLLETALSGAAAVLVLTAPPAYAGETLYEGNKTYEAELGALIASRNAKMPELKDAPSVAEPTKKVEPPKEEAPSAPALKLSDVPLKLSDVPKTLLETPSSVPEPEPVPAAPFEQPSAPTLPYPAAPAPPSFFSAPEPPKAEAPAPAPFKLPSPPQAASPAPPPSIPVPSVPAEAPSGPSIAIGLGGVAVVAAAGLAVANGGGNSETSASANGATPTASSSGASPPEDPALAAKENAKEAAEWIKKWRESQ